MGDDELSYSSPGVKLLISGGKVGQRREEK